jgi:hypothetical protein
MLQYLCNIKVIYTMSRINMIKMKEGIGKFVNRGSASPKKTYDSFFLYFPSEVARDSNFPFESGEKVKVIIEPNTRRVILEKIE